MSFKDSTNWKLGFIACLLSGGLGLNCKVLPRSSHTFDAQERSADDGKRLLSAGCCILLLKATQRGEFEKGGLDVGLDRRSADSQKLSFPMFVFVAGFQ